MLIRTATVIALFIWTLSFAAVAQRKPTEGLKTILETHRTVAILPFTYVYDKSRLPMGMNVEFLIKMEKDEGYRAQRDLYERMLKKRIRYYVDVQDIQVTNAMLAKAGVDYASLHTMDRAAFSDLLGVDGVITGHVDNTFNPNATWGGAMNPNAPTKTSVTVDLYDTHGHGSLWKLKAVHTRPQHGYTSGLDKKFVDKILSKIPYAKMPKQR